MSERVVPQWAWPWFEAAALREAPREGRANCAACVMCSSDDWTARHPRLQYNPATRCCTYQPAMVNFLVGAVLAGEGGVSDRAVQALQASLFDAEAMPYGVVPRVQVDGRYQASVEQGGFGRDPRLRCTYLSDDGGCGVWSWRSSICATWFCRHERGMVGMGYWIAVKGAIDALEKALAQLAAQAILPEAEPYTWPPGYDDPHRRRAYYLDCFALVAGLDPHEVLPTLPEDAHLALRLAGRAKVALDRPALPDAPTVHERQVVEDLGDRVRLSTYTSAESLLLDKALYFELGRFDGRPLAEVREELGALGVVVDDLTILKLVDFDVLR